MRRVSLSGFYKPRFVVAVGALTLALGLVAIGQPPLPRSDDEAASTYDVTEEPSSCESCEEIVPVEGADVQAADVAALQVCPQPAPDPNGNFPFWDDCSVGMTVQ